MTTFARDYVHGAAFMADGSTPSSGTWAGGFASLQDVSGAAVRLQIGDQIVSSSASYTASLTGTSPAQWAALCGAFA